MMKNLTVVYDKRILNFAAQISHRKFLYDLIYIFLIKLNQILWLHFWLIHETKKRRKKIKTSSTIYVCEIFMFHIIKDPVHFVLMSFFIIRFIFTALEIGIYVFINVQEHFTHSIWRTTMQIYVYITPDVPYQPFVQALYSTLSRPA